MQAASRKLLKDGLWQNNPALVQLLGLCPLLAVTNNVVNALGLGLVTSLVLVAANALVSLTRNRVNSDVRLPTFVMIIAALVTIAELLMQAFTYELYQILGIFIPLIVTNCAILGRAEAYACKNPVAPAILDGLAMGVGFSLVLVLLGAMREILGQGTLFADMHLLFGEAARNWTLTLIGDYRGFLFAILPPGAFIGMGLLIAAKNLADSHIAKRQQDTTTSTKESRRIRVTGTIT
ncbi:MAG: electron transport complex subunit E [Gammaproteobacteria bacterium]|jgi:electron transport complex protein RnfE|nr:electron transport complex subunit E [Gammaproteobacteria bacterium]